MDRARIEEIGHRINGALMEIWGKIIGSPKLQGDSVAEWRASKAVKIPAGVCNETSARRATPGDN